VRAFGSLVNDNAVLIIAGKADANDGAYLRECADRDRRIRLLLGYQSPDDLHDTVAASDLVCIPFSNVLHSGSAHLAGALRRMVLLPKRGSLSELVDEFAPGQISLFDPPLTDRNLEEALRRAREADAELGLRMSQDWSDIASAHSRFFSDLTVLS
jgi:hypothetical protein